MLNVPYVSQINEHACGAAALEMVYRYYRSGAEDHFSQTALFTEHAEFEPHGSGARRITTDNIVAAARKRELFAGWGRVSTDRVERLEQLRFFLLKEKVPLIACQQFSEGEPLLGHFRVLLAADENRAFLHDPHPKRGGPSLEWKMNKLTKFWRHSGQNVTGGVAIWIADRALATPLHPNEPNKWAMGR